MKIIEKEIIHKLYIDERMSDQKIADKLNLKRRDITRLRTLYNIRPIEDFERHPYQTLSSEEKQLLVGTILGDAHIRRRGTGKTYPQVMISQTTKHEEYFYWLKGKLGNWVYDQEKEIKIQKKYNSVSGNHNYALSFQTICHPVFNEFYDGFYKDRKKFVNFDLLEKYFTDLSLAIWHMDDGGIIGNQKRIRLSTNGFTLQEVEGLHNFLLKKYNLKTWIGNVSLPNGLTHDLHFDKESGIRMSEIIKDIVVPSMHYKLASN